MTVPPRGPCSRHCARTGEELLSNDLMFEDRKIPVTPAGVHVITVYVRDLPVDLSEETVKSAFSSYGEVYSVCHGHFKDFPDLRNGNRLILMSVCNPIPSSLNVLGFVCRTWHPLHCTICKESGHLPRACPLSGLCRRCKQPGHVARECGHAGGQPRPSSSAPAPVPVPVPVPVEPVPVDPVPDDPVLTGSEDDGDLSSVSSDHPDLPLPSYPSLTVDDIPRRPLTKHTKRLSSQPTAFPFSSPKVPVIPKSKSVSFRK